MNLRRLPHCFVIDERGMPAIYCIDLQASSAYLRWSAVMGFRNAFELKSLTLDPVLKAKSRLATDRLGEQKELKVKQRKKSCNGCRNE